jgi:hypothetical protein
MRHSTEFNRRRHRRYSVLPQYSRISVIRRDGSVVEGHVHDVSAGGIRFECDDQLQGDEAIEFDLELPGTRRRLNGRARVARCEDQDVVGPWMTALRFEQFQTQFESASFARFLDQGWVLQAA